MKDLRNELDKYSKILIYGAGYYAKFIYSALKKEGLKEKIESFLVTNLNETRDIDGIKVNAASALTVYDKEKTAVIIAVNRENEREIIKTLKWKYGFEHGIKLLDFIIQDDNVFYEKLRTESDEWFLEKLMESYIWNHSDSGDELKKKREETEECISHRNKTESDNNTIVFISGNLTPRSEKIIAALTKKMYRIIVLEYGYCNELVKSEIMSSNIEFFSCKNLIEVFYRALLYKPLVYYFEPVWGDCSGSEIMIRHKGLFGKIVFAPYDILNAGYVQILDIEKLMEWYCLEYADGVAWRWFSKKFLEEKKGLVQKGKSIQFLDYCKGFEIENDNRSDDTLKICFVQGAIYELLNKSVSAYENLYAEPAKLDAVLKKIGNVSNCVFHIFLGRCADSDKKKLEKFEKDYSNVKFFYGMEYNELLIKISEYDYGSYFMTDGKDIPEQKSIDNIYYGNVYNDSIVNRFFDYLDAGLPIISTLPQKQCNYLDQYGVIVKMNINNLDIDYLINNKTYYRKNVKRAKKELQIDNHIQRLINWFYKL